MALVGTAVFGCGREASDGSGGEILLEDPYSPTGTLLVVQDDAGKLGVAVRGRIGFDSPELGSAAFSRTTLAGTYLALHPGLAVVPDHVRTLSDRLAAQHSADLAKTAPADLQPAASEALQPKDSAAFYANACQNFGGGFTGYSAQYCSYQYNWHAICTYNTLNTNDRSYAWNESPNTGYQTLSGMTWQPAVPAWTWQYAQYGGTFTNRYACLYLNGTNTYGNLGITHHAFYTDEALHGVTE
jgi:hypothetical protein